MSKDIFNIKYRCGVIWSLCFPIVFTKKIVFAIIITQKLFAVPALLYTLTFEKTALLEIPSFQLSEKFLIIRAQIRWMYTMYSLYLLYFATLITGAGRALLGTVLLCRVLKKS